MSGPRLAALLLLTSACALGGDGPAPAGSPSAEEAAKIAEIADQATQVQELARALTVQVDESRRAVSEGRSSPEVEAPKMQALADQLEARNAALQAEILALEARLHERSGDPTWPYDPAAE
jgi:small-conductance mechanosensitive channel